MGVRSRSKIPFSVRQFQLALCWFGVDELRRELKVTAPTISRWRNGSARPLHYEREELMSKLCKMLKERADGLR